MSSDLKAVAGRPPIPVWARIVLIFPAILVIEIPFTLVALTFGNLHEHLPSVIASEAELLLSTLMTCTAVLLAVIFFKRQIGKESFSSLGFATGRIGVKLIFALLTVLAIIGSGTVILTAAEAVQVSYAGINGLSLLLSLITFALVAFYEELLFRGYLLSCLLDKLGVLGSLTVSSLLFGLVHIWNSGIGVIPILNIVLAGYLLGVSYAYTRNLWYPIFLHFFWNFLQGPILGYKVSGATIGSALSITTDNRVYLSGGQFGFEGSIVCTGLLLLSIFLMVACFRREAAERR